MPEFRDIRFPVVKERVSPSKGTVSIWGYSTSQATDTNYPFLCSSTTICPTLPCSCSWHLAASIFLEEGISLLIRNAAKFNFVKFLKDPGMALTSVILHLEKSMSYCATACLQTLKGNIALDTLHLPCKFFWSTPWTTKFPVFKKTYKQLSDYSEYVAEHVLCLSCINLNTNSRPSYFGKKTGLKQIVKRNVKVQSSKSLLFCSYQFSLLKYSDEKSIRQNVRCSHVNQEPQAIGLGM